MLRITDILLRNLIWAMIHMDLQNRHKGTPSSHLDMLVESIRSCGVTFKVNKRYYHQYLSSVLRKVWNAKDGKGGRSKDAYEWTSLRGHDRRVLLKKLPSKIPSLVPGSNGESVKELWEVFDTEINEWNKIENFTIIRIFKKFSLRLELITHRTESSTI